MKQITLLVFIALSSLTVFSQIEKGDVLISAQGSYIQSSSESGVTSNYTTTAEKKLPLGASIGYFFADNVSAGLEIDYYWSDENRVSRFNTINTTTVEEMGVKSKVLMPTVFVGYYYPITSKFYFNTKLKFGAGKLKVEQSSILAYQKDLTTDDGTVINDGTNSRLLSTDNTNEATFFNTQLVPEFNYFITPKFSLSLGVGGVAYSLTDWKTDSSNWIVSFNPTYWTFGVKVKL